ncbi:MAG TPA: hypothetical protein VIT24_06055 [Acidimicrobiales bacterium]
MRGYDGGPEPPATAEGGRPFSVEEVSADSPELRAYNDALGESSVLFEVYVFEGDDPPLDTEAAQATASASGTFEDIGQGVHLGDFDTAYYANGDVVVRGPLLNGNPADDTLDAWRQVVDSL